MRKVELLPTRDCEAGYGPGAVMSTTSYKISWTEDVHCITHHRDFASVCLTPAVLHIVVNSMEEVRGYGVIEDWSNR